MIQDSEPLALTGVVVTEVLQGLTRDARIIESFLSQFHMLGPTGFETDRAAAAIFRTARGKGVSLTSIDTLIAAIAIEHSAAVFTLDNDFSRIALLYPLALYYSF